MKKQKYFQNVILLIMIVLKMEAMDLTYHKEILDKKRREMKIMKKNIK